ncbi:uncharacterized protein LOC118736267 [Rhagoletis pomonella]|uniref:uncharacterized protein LOC118736267 n=1 Tax=Rhagoletis pomonella TaxID=28610 RepID=UPI00177F2598|nr:uncharacterized protein LOC118736267 [Rhagoletis pomonella]
MRKTKAKTKPTKPDAIIVKKAGEQSYADILKKIKSQPELKELSANVKNIRKTAKNELLFELKKQDDPATQKFKTAVEHILGESAHVRSLTQESLLEVKDIDEVTTKDEVCEALIECLGGTNLEPTVIRSMCAAYGDTQICTLSLPSAITRELVEKAKIRIGWVNCRIRFKEVLARCYRCHDYGHMSRNCKSAEDRSALCFRCGGKDHKARD